MSDHEINEARARVEIITPSKNNPAAEYFSSSNTPETDAAVIASNGQWSFVLKETCQRLERERNEARNDLEFRRELYRVQGNYLEQARKERDEEKKIRMESDEAWDSLVKKLEEVSQERDEAMQALSGRTVSCAACNHAAIERDEAREDARLLAERLTRLELDSSLALAKLERERNELKKALETEK